MRLDDTRSGRAIPRAAIVLAWLGTIAVDFGFHGGLLAPAYDWSNPFLLSRMEAFVRIPVAYAGLLVLVAGLAWLLSVADVADSRSGARLGAAAGGVAAAVFLSALWTISTVDLALLASWWVAVVLELAFAGWVLGGTLGGRSSRSLVRPVVVVVLVSVVMAIVLQSLGYAQVETVRP